MMQKETYFMEIAFYKDAGMVNAPGFPQNVEILKVLLSVVWLFLHLIYIYAIKANALLMTTFSSNIVFKLKALGIYQLVFAVAGLGVTLWLFLQQGLQFSQLTIVFIVVILIYLFAIYCGVSCFQTKEKCLWYSSINQYLQLISFSIAGYGFMYDSGLSVNLGIDLTTNFTIRLKMQILSFWHIDYNTDSDVIFVNLNLLALAVILIIDQMKKQMKQEIEGELLTIGDSGI